MKNFNSVFVVSQNLFITVHNNYTIFDDVLID